jgi:hypothetical protein
MNSHLRPTATKIRLIGGATRYRPTIVDTKNRPHVKTYVGTTQVRTGTAKAIAEAHVSANNEKAR